MPIVPYGLGGVRDIGLLETTETRFSGFGRQERISRWWGVGLTATVPWHSKPTFHAVIRQVFRRAESFSPRLVAGKSRRRPVAVNSSSLPRCRETPPNNALEPSRPLSVLACRRSARLSARRSVDQERIPSRRKRTVPGCERGGCTRRVLAMPASPRWRPAVGIKDGDGCTSPAAAHSG